MKNKIKKCICMALVMCMATSMLIADVQNVQAVDFSTYYAPEDTFEVSYDESKYTIFWASRKKITCKSQYGSMWGNLAKNDKLGTATIRIYYLEPKEKTGGYYYGTTGCQVSMNPVMVKGDVSGMAQLADFGIKTINADSRVCSPTAEILDIQSSSTTTTSGNFKAGTGVTYNSSKKAWEASGKFEFGASWGSSSSYTYNRTNVILTQKTDNNGYANWRYDYKSKDGDVTWNAYLMSSSNVAGQVVYRLCGNIVPKYRAMDMPTEIDYDIRFGAGNASNGKVANRLGWSTNRDMSVETGTMELSY